MKVQTMKKLSVTIKQTNELTGLSIRKIYDLICEGKLKSVTVGRRRLILYESLEKLLAAK
jgi:excisionase family DNA binding protein